VTFHYSRDFYDLFSSEGRSECSRHAILVGSYYFSKYPGIEVRFYSEKERMPVNSIPITILDDALPKVPLV
jgi:hypothetical protein